MIECDVYVCCRDPAGAVVAPSAGSTGCRGETVCEWTREFHARWSLHSWPRPRGMIRGEVPGSTYTKDTVTLTVFTRLCLNKNYCKLFK